MRPVASAAPLALLAWLCVVVHAKYGRIAVVTVADPGFQPRAQAGIYSKQCYSLLHDYAFVLDVHPPFHGRSIQWNRVTSVHRLLDHFEWVWYSDADTFVTNAEVKIEELLSRAEAEHAAAAVRWPSPGAQTPLYFIVQDGAEVNSGGFLARGGEHANHTKRLLDRWWDLELASREWSVHDQGALAGALLEHAVLYTGFRRRVGVDPTYECLSAATYWQFWGCYNVWLNRMGLPLGQRSVGGVVMLPGHFVWGELTHESDTHTYTGLRAALASSGLWTTPAHTGARATSAGAGATSTYSDARVTHAGAGGTHGPRGFNMVSAVWEPELAWHAHPSHQWAPGDFVAHVTSSPRFASVYAQWAEVFGNAHARRCPRGQLWEMEPRCDGPPCPHELWEGRAHTHTHGGPPVFIHENRWRGYVPEAPAVCMPLPFFASVQWRGAHALRHPHGGRALVLPAGTHWRPQRCPVRGSVLEAEDGAAAVTAGPFRAPGLDALLRMATLPVAMRPRLCDPSWAGHLHARIVINATNTDVHEGRFLEEGEETGSPPLYRYIVADIAVSPWEDVASRVMDAASVIGSDEVYLGYLLATLVAQPHMLQCVPGLRGEPSLPPRRYENSSDHFESVLTRVEGTHRSGHTLWLLPCRPWRKQAHPALMQPVVTVRT